jgi:transposase
VSESQGKEKLRASVDFWLHQKWPVIDHALVDPRPAGTIARHLGVSVPVVHTMISLYQRSGPAALDTPGSGGRRRQSLTLAEAQHFMAPFLRRAATGEIATISAIQTAFEAQVQH